MPNYLNSMIYKLCCNDPTITDCYVGSTLNFKCRKSHHKSICNKENSTKYNNYKYQFIRGHGGFENWSMILIENFPCDTKLELHKRERYWLETLGATLNKEIPSRSKKEYYVDNKEKITKLSKDYYKNNKEEINAKKKIYREKNRAEINAKKKEKFNCECGGKYCRSAKSGHFRSQKHQAFISNS